MAATVAKVRRRLVFVVVLRSYSAGGAARVHSTMHFLKALAPYVFVAGSQQQPGAASGLSPHLESGCRALENECTTRAASCRAKRTPAADVASPSNRTVEGRVGYKGVRRGKCGGRRYD